MSRSSGNCAKTPGLESMLLARIRQTLFQQRRHETAQSHAALLDLIKANAASLAL
jgi:hypothetical protein